MADDKQGRDDQAADGDRRQRVRALKEELERMNEPEPIDETLDELEGLLETYDYPATATELNEEFSDRTLDTTQGPLTIGDVFELEPGETYNSATEVRKQIRESVTDTE